MPSSRPGEVRDEEDLCGEGDVDEPDHLGHKSLVKGVGRLVSRARHGLFSPRRQREGPASPAFARRSRHAASASAGAATRSRSFVMTVSASRTCCGDSSTTCPPSDRSARRRGRRRVLSLTAYALTKRGSAALLNGHESRAITSASACHPQTPVSLRAPTLAVAPPPPACDRAEHDRHRAKDQDRHPGRVVATRKTTIASCLRPTGSPADVHTWTDGGGTGGPSGDPAESKRPSSGV